MMFQDEEDHGAEMYEINLGQKLLIRIIAWQKDNKDMDHIP